MCKTSLFYLILFGLFLSLTACEKVIEIDLEDASPEWVVEANLAEGKNWFEVRISQTTSYFSNETPPAKEGARVLLSDDKGNTYPLTELGNGLYGDTITAEVNTLYTLTAEIDENTYTAQSFLKPSVPVLSLEAEFQNAFGPRADGYIATFTYQDPPNEANYYRAVYFIDGEKQTGGEALIILNDLLNDGNVPRVSLVQEVLEEGQELRVALWHIDEASYNYFTSLGDIIGAGRGPNQGSAAPGNPNSNWSGGILGYFTAYSASQEQITVE